MFPGVSACAAVGGPGGGSAAGPGTEEPSPAPGRGCADAALLFPLSPPSPLPSPLPPPPSSLRKQQRHGEGFTEPALTHLERAVPWLLVTQSRHLHPSPIANLPWPQKQPRAHFPPAPALYMCRPHAFLGLPCLFPEARATLNIPVWQAASASSRNGSGREPSWTGHEPLFWP